MRFSLVNHIRTLPTPGVAGLCPACGSPMSAKCGTQRVWHWAHRRERTCDSWWERETPWHRTWKEKFPASWQEVIRYDDTGEKHIADIHTEHGLTIEFQYSHLRPEERAARERFYRNMAWVVTGARLKRDFPRFLEGSRSFRKIATNGVYIAHFPNEAFPKGWLTSAMPVFFDFVDAVDLTDQTRHIADWLWCLLPGRIDHAAVVLRIARSDFVALVHERAILFGTRTILEKVALIIAQERARQEAEYLAAFRRTISSRRQWRPRRPSGRPRRWL